MGRRGKRRDRPGPIGFLVVDKPIGWTSHDVVDAARRWFGIRRIGHLGTLDPLATGVLPLAIREATKLVPFLEGGEKVYVGTIRLGVSTDTFDAEGDVVYRHEDAMPNEASVREALASFVGDIEQIPPMYSSVKKDGVPLYKLARRGEEVEREPRSITIHRAEMTDYSETEIGIEISCTPGTYVRSLAHDMGEKLGCGAHLSGLRRTRSGLFDLEQASLPEVLEAQGEARTLEDQLLAPDVALGFPRVSLSAAQARKISNGGDLAAADARGEWEQGPAPRPGLRVSAMSPAGELLAILELRPDRRLHPLRVLVGA